MARARVAARQLCAPLVVQELRDLTRTRKQLMRDLGQHAQRIEKVLEDANIKLTTVLTDVVGQAAAGCSRR